MDGDAVMSVADETWKLLDISRLSDNHQGFIENAPLCSDSK